MSGLEYNPCYAVSNLQVFRRILHIQDRVRVKEAERTFDPSSNLVYDASYRLSVKDNSMTMIVTAMIWSVIRKLNTGIIEMEWNGNRMEWK